MSKRKHSTNTNIEKINDCYLVPNSIKLDKYEKALVCHYNKELRAANIYEYLAYLCEELNFLELGEEIWRRKDEEICHSKYIFNILKDYGSSIVSIMHNNNIHSDPLIKTTPKTFLDIIEVIIVCEKQTYEGLINLFKTIKSTDDPSMHKKITKLILEGKDDIIFLEKLLPYIEDTNESDHDLDKSFNTIKAIVENSINNRNKRAKIN